jgi:hypothetical protein
VALLIVAAAAASSVVTYAIVRKRYNSIANSQVVSPAAADRAFMEVIWLQPERQNAFFSEASNRVEHNLSLIKRGCELAEEQRKRFCALHAAHPDEKAVEDAIDRLMGGVLPDTVPLHTSPPTGRELFLNCVIWTRLGPVPRVLESNVSAVPKTGNLPPSVWGYLNLYSNPVAVSTSQINERPITNAATPTEMLVPAVGVSSPTIPIDQMGFLFGASCACQATVLLIGSLPMLMQRYFPNLFFHYSILIRRIYICSVKIYSTYR